MNPVPDINHSDSSIINIYELFSIIYRFKFFIIIITFISCLFAYYYSSQKPNIYIGNLEILIDTYRPIDDKIREIQSSTSHANKSFSYTVFLSEVLSKKKYIYDTFPNILPEDAYKIIDYKIVKKPGATSADDYEKVVFSYSSVNKTKTKEVLYNVVDLIDISLKDKISSYVLSLVEHQKHIDGVRLIDLINKEKILYGQVKLRIDKRINYLKSQRDIAIKLGISKVDTSTYPSYILEDNYLKGYIVLDAEIRDLEIKLQDNDIQIYSGEAFTAGGNFSYNEHNNYRKVKDEIDKLQFEPPHNRMLSRYEESGISSEKRLIPSDAVNYYYSTKSRKLFVDIALGFLLGLFLSIFSILLYHSYNRYRNHLK